MKFSRTLRIFAGVLLLVLATTAQTASAQTTPPRKVIWLHGRGEEGQTYWHRFADDILRGRNGESDLLWRFDYNNIDGYYSPYNISQTAQDIYFRRVTTSASLSLTNRANNPIFIGHSQGGIVARELDRNIINGTISNGAPLGGIITVGSPNGGVGLLKARQTIVPNTNKNQIQYASEQAMLDILPGPVLDPKYGLSAFAFLGTEFIHREGCITEPNILGDIWAYANAFLAGGIGFTVGAAFDGLKPFIGSLSRFISGQWLVGYTPSSPYILPGGNDVVAWLLPGLSAAAYQGLEQNFLVRPDGSIDVSVQQMAPDNTGGLTSPSLIPLLNSGNSSTPRAGIYGTAALQSPIRLLSNQIGRSKNFTNDPLLFVSGSIIFDKFTRIDNIPLPVLSCRTIQPGEYFFTQFAKDIPEKQAFNQPNDTRFLRYYNRVQDIYHTGKDINNGIGYITLPLQGLIFLTRLAPTSFDVAQAYERGERFLSTEFQNTYSYLIRATRTVSTTRRITINYYSCPSAPGQRFNFPISDDCVYVSEEVDRVFEYTVSAGDDGFIAQQDQEIPLRTGISRDFENNFRAGLNSSCNHFTEGNHPEVHQQLRRLLAEDRLSPFYIP